MEEPMTNRIVHHDASTPTSVSLSGCLLVAAPNRENSVFERTVCMIVHHDQQGAIGIVLNRGFPHEASTLMQQIAGSHQSQRSGLLHFGGPHSGPVVALHNCDAFAEYQSADGVYLAAQIQNVRALVTSPNDACDVKIMVGQADWQAGELDREFEQGLWLPLPVTSQLVFADDQQMWPSAMRRVGDHYLANLTGAILPENPLLN